MINLDDYINKSLRNYDRLSAIRRLYERGNIDRGMAAVYLIERTTVPNNLAEGVVKIWDEGIFSCNLRDTRWNA